MTWGTLLIEHPLYKILPLFFLHFSGNSEYYVKFVVLLRMFHCLVYKVMYLIFASPMNLWCHSYG